MGVPYTTKRIQQCGSSLVNCQFLQTDAGQCHVNFTFRAARIANPSNFSQHAEDNNISPESLRTDGKYCVLY